MGNKVEAHKHAAYLVEDGMKAVKLAPNDHIGWQLLGWDEYRAGAWKASIDALATSCKLERGTGDGGQWIVLALARARLAAQDGVAEQERAQHRAEARRWFEQTVKQNPGIWIWRFRPTDPIGDTLWDFRAEAAELIGASEKKK